MDQSVGDCMSLKPHSESLLLQLYSILCRNFHMQSSQARKWKLLCVLFNFFGCIVTLKKLPVRASMILECYSYFISTLTQIELVNCHSMVAHYNGSLWYLRGS